MCFGIIPLYQLIISRWLFLNYVFMAEIAVIEYSREGDATNSEVEDFLDWCQTLCGDGGKEIRYEVYRLWARILRKRRTPFHQRNIFIHDDLLKTFLRQISGVDVSDE